MLIAITNLGCEEACEREVARWTDAKTTTTERVVRVQCSDEEAYRLAYHLQIPTRVLITDKEPEGTFKVEPVMLTDDDPDETIEDVARRYDLPVDLSNPDTVVIAVKTENELLVGIDPVGKPLTKRDWRIMLSRRSLTPTIAAAAAVLSGAQPDEIILDPAADDGTLAIETALLISRTSPRKFERRLPLDKHWEREDDAIPTEQILAFAKTLQEVKSIRMNSKLAGVEKRIKATRVTVDWLDLKIEPGSIDRILTYPESTGPATPNAADALDDLCNQAAYVLKKDGVMTCVTDKLDELEERATKYGFAVRETHTVKAGGRDLTIVTFINKKPQE